MRSLAALAALPTAGALAYGWASFVEPNILTTEQVEFKSPRVPRELDGLKIGQISDLHIGGWPKLSFIERAVDALNALKPDLVTVTGDLIHAPGLAGTVAKALRNFRAPLGSYAIYGNHDRWHDADAVGEALSASGHTVLVNASKTLSIHGVPLAIVGLDDIWEDKQDMRAALRDVEPHTPALLLAHEPDYAPIAATAYPFIGQLSGHTHGGQVRFPFIGATALPPWGRNYVMGSYTVDNMRLYVTRGVGGAGARLRFYCPPEITLITLRHTVS